MRILSAFILVVIIYLNVVRAEEQSRPDILITEEDIKRMNVRTIVEILNRIPGVTASESSVTLHGSRMVTVLLNEKPLNDPLSVHPVFIKWDLVSLEEVEKIQIYKSGGAAFGGTSGGVILITTKKATTSQGVIEASFGNLNTQNYTFNYMKNIKSFGIGLTSEWNKTGGYRVNDDKDKKKIRLKLGYETQKHSALDLSIDYYAEDRGRPGLPAFPTLQARGTGDALSSSFGLKTGSFKSDSYFNLSEKKETDPDKQLYTKLKSWTVGETLRTGFSAGKLGSFDTGINIETAHIEGNKVKTLHEEKCGIYLIKNIRFKGSPLNAGLGVRINLYSRFPAVMSPKVKLGYSSDLISIHATARATHNIPTFLQRYYETSYLRPNPNLRMEKGMDYSLSISHKFLGALEEDVSFFYSRIKDRITYVRKDEGIGMYENLGEVTRKGIETSVKWKPLKSLELKPSYTYLIAKDETRGYWLTASPRHGIKLNARYEPVKQLSLALDAQYVSKQFTRADNKEFASSYYVADLRIDYFIKKVGSFLKIENILNKSYLYGDGYPAPPRTFLAGANVKF
ncbi:MAG: TonB-dependent receptor [Nitrospirota bacterium]